MPHFGRIIGLLFCLQGSSVLAAEEPLVWDESQELLDWDRAIKGFRHDHNFALMVGRVRSDWKGRVDSQKYEFQSDANELSIAYSFHIPWSRGFGYTLGTSSAVMLSESNKQGFSTHYRVTLPGVELGIVWNLNNRLRFNTGVVYGWERVDQLRLSESLQHKKLSITGETASLKLTADYFFKLTWGARFEVELSKLCYPAKSICYATKDSFDLEKNSAHARLGFVKHVL